VENHLGSDKRTEKKGERGPRRDVRKTLLAMQRPSGNGEVWGGGGGWNLTGVLIQNNTPGGPDWESRGQWVGTSGGTSGKPKI